MKIPPGNIWIEGDNKEDSKVWITKDDLQYFENLKVDLNSGPYFQDSREYGPIPLGLVFGRFEEKVN